MAVFSSIVAWEAIGVEVICPLLQLVVALHLCVILVEVIDYVLNVALHSIPEFQPIITVVVAWKGLRIIKSSFFCIALDVGPVDAVAFSTTLVATCTVTAQYVIWLCIATNLASFVERLNRYTPNRLVQLYNTSWEVRLY